MFANKWLRYLILILMLFVGVTILFWGEIVDGAKGGFNSLMNEDGGSRVLADTELSKIKEVYFKKESNNLDEIKVGNIRVVNKENNEITLGVGISSSSENNDYPSLRVTVLSNTGKVLRFSDFGPDKYEHQSKLSSEVINLTIPAKTGDSSFNVSAFYGSELEK